MEALDLRSAQNTTQSKPWRSHDVRAQTHVSVTSDSSTKSKSTFKCIGCNLFHQLFRCKEFSKLAIPARVKELRRCRACLNRLKRGHWPNTVYTVYAGPAEGSTTHCCTCRTKGRAQNSPTSQASPCCLDSRPRAFNSSANAPRQGLQPTSGAVTSHSINLSVVLLPTPQLTIFDHHDRGVNCRALIDSSSQSCFITAKMCGRLR